nr:hypothetical protein [Tanacetum cinerariifolium]
HTRPDIAYAVGVVSQFMHQHQVAHMVAVFRIIRYLKGTPNLGVLFRPNGHLNIQIYTDADWAGDKGTRRSVRSRLTIVKKHLGKSGKNDVNVMKRAQSIYRDEHKGVAFCQEDAWAILKFHPKWDAPEQVDLTGDVPGATQEDLFGHDARPRPAGKSRHAKKTKSDARASTGGSSASTQFGELMEQELRLKRKVAERAFEAQAEKDRTLMRLEELRFLATSTKYLDNDDAYWTKKQTRLIKNKIRNDLDDEDDEDE